MNTSLELNSPEYKTIHRKVNELCGSAKEHKCVKCLEKDAKDWSYIHGKNPNDVESYQPLCRSCHMIYDGPTRGVNHGSARLTEAQVLEIRAIYNLGRLSQRQLARKFGVARTTIDGIVTRKRRAHI